MNKTKIDWCDSTWNPVTGCLHGCEYCYARNIAKRFGGWSWVVDNDVDTLHATVLKCDLPIRELDESLKILSENGTVRKAPYPYDFIPTLHRYRLNEYQNKKGRNIFVCSMADLFGKWVPDEWIEEVFKACEKAPQHNYLFLTKNPKRYFEMFEKNRRLVPSGSNMWYGFSVTDDYYEGWYTDARFTFASIEPILGPISHLPYVDWIIVGAETGNRKDKVVPEREWLEKLVELCRKADIPLFMKSSLADIWGEPLIQEFPEALRRGRRGSSE